MSPIFGKLSFSQIPTHWEELIAQAVIIGGFLAVVGLITWYGKWRYIWHDWLTTLDHKKIGIMYIVLANVMLLRGFVDAIMMRSQLALGTGGSPGYLKPDHFDQVFTAHGTIMIFFMAMPFMVGLLNVVLPLQIGARDVSFPYLNAISLWLTVAGAMLVNVPLLIGHFARVGWVAYPPLSELAYSPGVGVDYYCWALQVAGAGSLMSGINFFVTIVNKRAPGMTFGRMPIFVWTALATSMLMMAAFPILTVTLALLSFDRYLGGHFFTNTAGGDPMMYINLFWAWGHPEVYILALPPFGIFSSVIPCFSGKPLFGYKSMIFATIGIAFISFLVWVHHFFTMGAGGNVNGFFGIMTMIIAVPTGVKVFNWLFTMYRGRIRFTVPMMWSVAFLVTFTIGGMSGVMLSLPAADFVLHNSLFLIAHFHNVLIGGTLFGFFAGYNFWFPKALGFQLDEKLGKCAFWFWTVGFYCAFMPLYVLGFMGMTRRMDTTNNPEWTPYLWFALFGALLIMIGIGFQIWQLARSFRQRERLIDTTGDPWDGRMLEWSIFSPPPVYNFARLPQVSTKEPFWDRKHGTAMLYEEDKPYESIEVPRTTPYAIGVGVAAGLTGFALVWYIWWLAAVGLLAVAGCLIVRSFQRETEMTITPEQIAKMETGKSALFATDNGLAHE